MTKPLQDDRPFGPGSTQADILHLIRPGYHVRNRRAITDSSGTGNPALAVRLHTPAGLSDHGTAVDTATPPWT